MNYQEYLDRKDAKYRELWSTYDEAKAGFRQNGRPRDSRRQRLYDAEQAISAWTYSSNGNMTLYDVREWVDEITSTRWYRNRPFPTRVHVKDGRGRRRAGGKYINGEHGTIKMPRWSRSKIIVLHELAHACTPPYFAFHGPEFCKVYLMLVKRFLGRDVWEELRDSMTEHGVQYIVR